MSGSYEFSAEDRLFLESLGASCDTKPHLSASAAITSHNQHKPILPSFTNESYDSWPPDLWSPENTPKFTPPQPGSSASPYQPTNSSETGSDSQSRNLQDAIEQYIRYIPRMNRVNADNYGAILVDVVKETEKEVSLDTFFRLLYTLQPAGSSPTPITLQDFSLQFTTLEASSKGLALCRLIHDTFTDPLAMATDFGVDAENISAIKLSAHEFHRIFLATKILLHCVKVADPSRESKASLAKTSIYNMYQICIYRLFDMNSSNIDRESSPESLIVGQASIGRLMRTIFTNATSKRLGKRGNSKYHFTGVTWRLPSLDNETRHLIQLEPSQVKQHFGNTMRKVANKPVPKPSLITQSPVLSQPPLEPMPFLSYVKSSSRFPAVDFSPRVKAICPRRVPEQPQWMREVMNRSIKALEQYNVYLRQPIEEFQAGDYGLGTQSSYYRVIVCAEKEFFDKGWEDAYLHLHTTILSSVLPAMLASDEEISPASKILIRASTRKLIKELEEKEAGRSPFEKNHRRMFMSNLQKMVNLSETTSVVLPKHIATDIVQIMIQDFADLKKGRASPSDETASNNLCVESIITMINAFPHVFPTVTQDKVSMVNRIIKLFQEMCTELITHLHTFLEKTKSGDSKFKVEALPFEVFKMSVESGHKWFLNREIFLQIPIPVIRLFFTKLDREFQSRNFQGFGKRHPQIATERFKTSWWITSAFHEYFFLLSELVALSQHLDHAYAPTAS